MHNDSQPDSRLINSSRKTLSAAELFEELYIENNSFSAATLRLKVGGKQPVPTGYPRSAGGLDKPWNFEQSLHYSKEWQERGGYKLLPLNNTGCQLDIHFVEELCKLPINSGYEIEDLTLLSDIGDEQAFIAQLDLLEKKHGNWVHGAKWKHKNHPDSPDTDEKKEAKNKAIREFNDRQDIRKQLKTTRYRTTSAPHVKLLPLWNGVNLEQVKNLQGTGFDDLSYTEDGELGKGYYGTSDAISAYEHANKKDNSGNQTLLVLSWYAGKVVYPTLTTDSELKGQPHYANHDLHYRYTEGQHTAVVFEPGQVLPRYLVSIKKSGVPSGVMPKLLKLPFSDLGKGSLLLQNNFAHVISKIGQNSLSSVKNWLSSTPQSLIQGSHESFVYENLLTGFLTDPKLEVLLLKTADIQDGELLSRAIESKLWNEYQTGNSIGLHIDLTKFNNKDNIFARALAHQEIVDDAIEDLRQQQKFNFIISGYDQDNKVSLKGNYFNRSGGFSGKVIVVLPADELAEPENWVFHTEGGTSEQQQLRLISHQLNKFTAEQIAEQLAYISNIVAHKSILLPQEAYNQSSPFLSFSNAHNLLPTPGGELKPWEYSNELKYSPNWQDKGAFKLHKVQESEPDYDFVQKMYQETAMPDYELDEVYVISDRGAEQAFIANLNTLERSSLQAKPQTDWEQEGHIELRKASLDLLASKSYKTLLTENVKVLPLWHGTGPAAAAGIAKSGFASLALVDCGYFGKGLYGSNSAEYSYRVYGKGMNDKDGLLILSWYSAQQVYPVVKWDTYPGVSECDDKLKGKANYQHYDSHFVRVKPKHPERHYVNDHSQRTEDVYYPIGENEKECYQEFVTFATAQVLPRYIISLKATGGTSLSGMQKFLDTRIETPITQGLYQDDLEQTIAKLKESAKSEREEDFILSQGLSLYIPSFGANSDKIDNVPENEQHSLLVKSLEFLTHPKQELLLIQGNAGSGKSLFGRYLERELWNRYEDGRLIPLFIPLPRLGELSDDLIAKALQLKGITTKSILELKKTKKFLFILDGYDEIPGKPKLLQEYKFNEPGNWQGKIIIGSRLQYLTSKEEQLLYPKHEGDTITQSISLCTKSYIIPFSQEQITSYIDNFTKSDFNKVNWQLDQYQEKLKEFPEINEFLKEPFLLFLVLSVLPELTTESELKKIDLYDAFTKGWFNSQFDRMVKYAKKELSKYTKQYLLEKFNTYAQDLAFQMFLSDTQVIRHNPQGEVDSVFNRFFADEEAKLAFQGSPLKKIGESYLFIHKSFQEYFVAIKVLNELSEELLSISSLEQKLMVDSHAILNFISQKILNPLFGQKSNLEERLFEIILNSRTGSLNLTTASANAATILNTARIAFSGKDLRGVKLQGANLTGAILDHTNLEKADLSNVKLKEAWLSNANLSHANLTGTIFGELAYKYLGDPVNECKYSPDGKYFAATTDSEKTIYYKVEETGSLTEITSPDPLIHNCQANSTTSPNGQYCATIKNENIELYKIDESGNKTLVNTITGHTSPVLSVTFSPDNQWLASGSSDATVRLWDISDPTKTQTLAGHTDYVHSVTFSPDNQWLASGGSDATVRLWDISDPTKTHTLTGHTSSVFSVTFSPDNQWLASGSSDATVRLWDISDPTKTQTLAGHNDYVLSVTFSPDNQWLASGSWDATVRLWDISDPTKTHTLTGHTGRVYSVTFSPDNQWLASGSVDATVRLWDISDPTKTHTLTGHTGSVNSVTFSPDNQWLASGSDDKTVRLWDISDPTKTHTLTGHTDSAYSATFSPDNQWLASGSPKEIIFWNRELLNDIDVWRGKFRVPINYNLSSLTYSLASDRLLLSVGGGDCSVRLFEQLPNDKLILLWTSTQTILSAEQADITFACLSTTNTELLTQRGALDYNNVTLMLFKALSKTSCNIEEIANLLARAGINAQHETTKNTPLMEAIKNKHLEATEMLLVANAAPNITNQKDETALHLAATNGCLESTKLLIKSGANINQTDNNGWTPLNSAAKGGHLDVVNALIAAKAEINTPSNTGVTPLYAAADEGHLEVVNAFIVAGAEVGNKTNSGTSAFSVSSKNQPILKLIVNQKLHNLSSKLFPQSPSIQQLFTNLIKEQSSFEQLIDFIIDNEGNLNETEEDQITLLMMAVAMESYEATEKLIIAGADKDKTDGHATVLHRACVGGSSRILTLLLEQGCSLEIPDSTGDYPELRAAEKDDVEKLQILLEFKRNGTYVIDINRIKGGNNKSLLGIAEDYEATKCITYLNELIAARQEQQISEKVSSVHLEPELETKAPPTPILFLQNLKTTHSTTTVEILLNNVAYGKQQEAEAILLQNPELALLSGNVIDCAGRSFEQITALQYAVWALDYNMWAMILKYIPETELNQQTLALNSGTLTKEHGNQASWKNLIEALQGYIDNYSHWNIEERSNYWAHTIGGAQLLLPAHVINEYSRPNQSFYPCPNYLQSNTALTTRTGVDNWKRISNNYRYILGDNFAWVKGKNINRIGTSVAMNLDQLAIDLKAITALLETRVTQAEQLMSSYTVTTKMFKLQIS
jgi:WD40 repeat protein